MPLISVHLNAHVNSWLRNIFSTASIFFSNWSSMRKTASISQLELDSLLYYLSSWMRHTWISCRNKTQIRLCRRRRRRRHRHRSFMKPRCSGQSICFRAALCTPSASCCCCRVFFRPQLVIAIKMPLPYDCDGMKQIVANVSNHIYSEQKKDGQQQHLGCNLNCKIMRVNMILIFWGVRKMHRMHCHGIYVLKNGNYSNNHNKVWIEIKTSPKSTKSPNQ